jgi:hypothetical protein
MIFGWQVRGLATEQAAASIRSDTTAILKTAAA